MVDAGARRFVSATDLGRGYSAPVSRFTLVRPFAPPLPPWARSIAHILTLTASLASFSPPLFLTAQSAAPPAFAHCMSNEPHNEGISHCESSLFNNEGICLREQ